VFAIALIISYHRPRPVVVVIHAPPVPHLAPQQYGSTAPLPPYDPPPYQTIEQQIAKAVAEAKARERLSTVLWAVDGSLVAKSIPYQPKK
jgi:hypothetical protein